MLQRWLQLNEHFLNTKNDHWNSGDPYEYFMGRWSKLMAPVFLDWLNFPGNSSWLDVGCGTGALSEAIFQKNMPEYLCSVDPSAEFIEKAKQKNSFNSHFFVGSVSALPFKDDSFDIVVSGLALNFFPDLHAAFVEMKRVLKRNGAIAAYVWDYAGKMEFLRLFWDAACEVDMNASKFDEGNRFSICNPDNLVEIFKQSDLTDIKTSFLDIHTVFANFDDYWQPFLGGQGPAPGYLASVDLAIQQKIKNTIQKKITSDSNKSIELLARAIAICGYNNR